MCLCFQIRTVCYGSQLVGGVLSRKAETDVSSQQLGKRLLLFSAQLSQCRTVLRLFDDLSMLAYSHSYGTGGGVSHKTTIPPQVVLFFITDSYTVGTEELAWNMIQEYFVHTLCKMGSSSVFGM